MTVDVESWQAIAAAVALLVVTVHNKWESRKTRKSAQRAVELSEPTGNGFARTVKDSLVRIEAAQERTELKIDDHLKTHAEAHVLNHPRKGKRELTEL